MDSRKKIDISPLLIVIQLLSGLSSSLELTPMHLANLRQLVGKIGAPSVGILVDEGLDGAGLHLVNRLREEAAALGAEAAALVHGLLERVVLPAEDVVTVLAEAGVVAHREIEGLARRRPERPVVELGCVPDHLVHELRDLDWVSRRAGAWSAEEVGRARVGVGDVVLVVGRVKVLAVPAAGEKITGQNIARRRGLDTATRQTYVLKRMLERMPPGQGLAGSFSVSTLLSMQGAPTSPPKLGPV